ncbi:hypothetical protein TVAG_288570 [Trichomonas vaginalis G3]|uniref:Uncharacterized protein n=1 Tax=Trichomonas vaginalis (strain ATCC PRA-98 / G3) TaxID=412133 RepID=A2FEB7_TRIV3|nr:myosin rod-like family protein [Trichomonas vaginalis G3]EAX96757.1 hypothetical protein TVAG_288570 [Trichomonas vaginalis G3]KAI5520162.1 myosin rod-like family protein [Trichomonas vaginalis G3]|eukprot:XP_001309687.1 hypothetical protein [Trichomonas vaginalis G3]
MSWRSPDRNPKKAQIPKCTLRGDAQTLRLSTRDDPKPKKEVVIPPAQYAPQGSVLAAEYVDNLKKQLYMLNAELRFAKDRAGVDLPPGQMSVDSAIRRLRMACAMHEEETNKKITELQNETNNIAQKASAINQNQALEELEIANERELEEMKSLEEAYVEFSNDIHVQNFQKTQYEKAKGFFENQFNVIQQGYETLKSQNEQHYQDLQTIDKNIYNLKKQKNELLKGINDSIREKRLQEEKVDFIAINSKKPKTGPPNMTIAAINTKIAKLEYELKAMLDQRKEMEHQVDVLLEKNVQLKAEYNDTKARLDEAHRIKAETENMFTAKYNITKKANDEQRLELEAVKKNRKEMKMEIQNLLKTYSDQISQVNTFQNTQQMLTEVIHFKKDFIDDINAENEQAKIELNAIIDENTELRKELNDVSHKLAAASEKLRNAQVIAEINEKDKNCSLENIPPELNQLLQSVVAVKGAIV